MILAFEPRISKNIDLVKKKKDFFLVNMRLVMKSLKMACQKQVL